MMKQVAVIEDVIKLWIEALKSEEKTNANNHNISR